MSKIHNENGIKTPILKDVIARVREQLEHRGMWLALLVDGAEKQGIALETFACDAINKCGCIQGKKLSQGSQDFRVLKKNLFDFFARKVFEMEIRECTEDKLSIDFHYCPLVKAWQKMGYDDARIKQLCDCAMCGDRGIISQFGGKLNLEQTIADGSDYCKIRFVKEREKQTNLED